jgi:hypothetical protein
MNDETRIEIAERLEKLAAQPVWNDAVWQECFDLVEANADDELIAHFIDDLIHYTGTPLFRREPRPADIKSYSQELRDMAHAVRSRMSLTDFKRNYGW